MQNSRPHEAGLTLIEVLIALAILGIALTAVIQSATQNIRNTLYLQNRMVATWTGLNIINQIRLNLISIPGAPDHLSETVETLGQSWNWEAMMQTTANPRIKRIIVDVYHEPDHHRFSHLESYIYANPSS